MDTQGTSWLSSGTARFSAGALCVLVVAAGTGLIPVAGLGSGTPALATAPSGALVTDPARTEPGTTTPTPAKTPVKPATPTPQGSVARAGITLSTSLSQGKVVRGSNGALFLDCRVNVSEKAVADSKRRPVDLGIVLDTSGSMSGAMHLLKRATLGIVERLGPQDRLTIVTYASSSRLLFQGSPQGKALANLERLVAGLTANGGTNMSSGLQTMTRALSGERDVRRVRRILLLTDGQANEGISHPAGLTQIVRGIRGKGLALSSVGLGTGYNEVLLSGLSDAGGGLYHYAAEPKALQAVYKAEVEALKGLVAQGAILNIRTQPGVRVEKVFSWQSATAKGGTLVSVGDLARGRSLKVLVRLKVPSGADLKVQDVAQVSLSYTHVDKTKGTLQAPLLSVGFTADEGQAKASQVAKVQNAVKKVRVATQLDKAREAAKNGRYEEAKRLVKGCKDIDGKADLEYKAADGKKRKVSYDELADGYAAPNSARGRRALKQGHVAGKAKAR